MKIQDLFKDAKVVKPGSKKGSGDMQADLKALVEAVRTKPPE